MDTKIFENYEEAETYILNIPKFTKKNSLETTKLFLDYLGNPGTTKKIIHVAGTNGKGSVCTYLNAILSEAGYLTGMFTSPHLIRMTERFQIAGKPLTKELFLEVFQYVMQKVSEYGKEYHPTFFELLFFMAMVSFEEKEVDFIILETGIGGRLDATNVIDNPIACVISKIGMDHMEYLGNSLEDIAFEKAGIIKKRVPVIYQGTRAVVSGVIEEYAQKMSAETFPVFDKNWEIHEIHKNLIDFSLKSRYYTYIRLSLSTSAIYQVENAALAVQTINVIDKANLITEDKIKAGLRSAIWVGRMEEVLPEVYVDGAHNEDGVQAFLETVKQDGCKGRRMLLFSVVKDKNYEKMIEMLFQDHYFTFAIAAKMENDRTISIEELQKQFEKFADTKYKICENIETALSDILAKKCADDRVYIVGSLYLIGQIKDLLRGGFTDD